MMKVAIAAVAAVFGVSCAALADASPSAPDVRRVEVLFGDLDLSNHDGAAAMLRRLEIASRRACRDASFGANELTQDAYTLCASGALAEVVEELANERVTALYEQRHSERSAR
jgi:UrcA family protein